MTHHSVPAALAVLVHLNMFELWKRFRFRSVSLDKKARSKLRKGASYYTSGYVFEKTPGPALRILFQVPPAKSVMEPKAQDLDDTKTWLAMLLIFCGFCGVLWMSCTCKRMHTYCGCVMFIWCKASLPEPHSTPIPAVPMAALAMQWRDRLCSWLCHILIAVWVERLWKM